ncbi:MAG: alpha/beta fold hydrolase [Phycisphaerales bacterium]|jgi:hypothetical protein|nr:alpha/beta fold hydrolase [Phycisphaerales bacterium]
MTLIHAGLLAISVLASSPPSDPLAGVWSGELATPGGPLALVMHISGAEDGGWTGSVDTPSQQSYGIPLSSIEFDGHALTVRCDLTQAIWTATLTEGGDTLDGVWAQRGVEIPLSCRRGQDLSPLPAALVQELEGSWEGTLDVGAIQLRIVMTLDAVSPTAMAGIMVSPDQSPAPIPIGRVEWAGDRAVRVLIGAIGTVFDARLAPGGATLSGSFTQRGMPLDLALKKVARVSETRRPQEPRPPFPYRAEEVSFPNTTAGITLAGTLTMPPGNGPFPAVVLISGSGLQDRNEEIFQHKPFWVLADHLARRGIAALRVDDRGVGGSTSTSTAANDTTFDFVTDVEAAVAFLRSRPEVSGGGLGLIGHSEGGVIAPLVAVKDADINFIVLLAGTGVRGDALLLRQGEAINRASGMSEDDIAAKSAISRALFDALMDESLQGDPLEARLHAIIETDPEFMEETSEAQEVALQAAIDKLTLPWIRAFLRHDPAPTLQRVTCPVLALNGELDLQVPHAQNLPGIAAALERGGNPDATTMMLPGLNHLFQHCETGLPAEYGRIEETFSVDVLDLIAEWISDRAATR